MYTVFKSNSFVDGTYTITGIGTTTYNFDLDNTTLTTTFDKTTSNPEYETPSINAYGSIKFVDLVDNNYGYNSIWINRNNNIFDNLDFVPKYEIQNLSKLLDII